MRDWLAYSWFRGARKNIVAFLMLLPVFLVASVGYCGAVEEPLSLDGNPRYPLVYAMEMYRRYLDLDSCALVSGDEDSFEVSARYISLPSPADDRTYACRFRKNGESDGALQVWDDYGKTWNTIYSPHDREAIGRALEEKGRVNYRLPERYMFQCIYRQIFGVPYEDDVDDEALRRSVVILLPRDNQRNQHHEYLWDDRNYPRVWAHQDLAWHLDKSSLYVEREEPPRYVLRGLVLCVPQFHNDDILPRGIYSYRLLYDEAEEKMYVETREKTWRYMPPDGSNAESGQAMYVGEAAFYLVYGKRFYGASPKWHSRLNYSFDVFKDSFYERIDGVGQ